MKLAMTIINSVLSLGLLYIDQKFSLQKNPKLYNINHKNTRMICAISYRKFIGYFYRSTS